jgi:capsular exopolysaccharide synthesis family protein
MHASYPPQGEDAPNHIEGDDRPNRRLAHRREMHLVDALFVIRRKKWLLITCVSCGLLFAVLLTWVAERRYSSTVTIQIHKEGGSALSLDDLSGVGAQIGVGDELSVDLLTDEMVIANDDIAIKVIEDLSLAEREPFVTIPHTAVLKGADASAWEQDLQFRDSVIRLFESRLRVSMVKGTRLINVTYTDKDPQQAAAVANAVVDAYLYETTQQRYDATAKTSKWLTNQISDLKAKVSQSQKEVNDFRQKVGILGVSPVVDTLHGGQSAPEYDHAELDRLSDLNRQLTQAEVARISSEAIYQLSQSQNADVFLGLASSQMAEGPSGASFFSAASENIDLLKQLRAQEGKVKLELASNATRYGARNPIIVELRSQLAELDTQIAQEMRHIGLQAKDSFDLAVTTENSIRQSVENEKQKIAQLNNSADQLLMLQQEEASNRTLYESLYGKLEAARVLSGAQSSNVTIVNPARVPSSPSRPQPVQNLGIGLLAGLMTGLFGVFASNTRDDVISIPEDIASIPGSSMLGLVPLFDRRSTSKGVPVAYGSEINQAADHISPAWVLRSPRSVFAESYRQIRTAILLSRSSRPPQTVLFASALSGDGKTTTCFNMGFAFGLQGSRVLLIDADLRRPTLHSRLDLPNDSGLSQCLSSDLDPMTVIHRHRDLESVSVLTAGPVPPMPSELLGSMKFRSLLESLKGQFDFIFIDAPPILVVTDAVLIAQAVEGVILVVKSGVTRRFFLRRVFELLDSSRNKMLGIVLNAVDVRSSEYNSSYGYYGDRNYYGGGND